MSKTELIYKLKENCNKKVASFLMLDVVIWCSWVWLIIDERKSWKSRLWAIIKIIEAAIVWYCDSIGENKNWKSFTCSSHESWQIYHTISLFLARLACQIQPQKSKNRNQSPPVLGSPVSFPHRTLEWHGMHMNDVTQQWTLSFLNLQTT